MNYLIKFTIKILLFLSIFLIASCGGAFKYKKTDSRKVPVNVEDRVAKNTAEGRGFRLSDLGKQSNTYEFASSNELWRASLTTLDFMPLLNADYSGGIIITDWYQEDNSENSIKITIRFLSNEIRVDGLKVSIYKLLTTCFMILINFIFYDTFGIWILAYSYVLSIIAWNCLIYFDVKPVFK